MLNRDGDWAWVMAQIFRTFCSHRAEDVYHTSRRVRVFKLKQARRLLGIPTHEAVPTQQETTRNG